MTDFYNENRLLDGPLIGRLQADIADLFHVDRFEVPREIPRPTFWMSELLRRSEPATQPAPQGLIHFVGELRHQDSEYVYDQIAERWRRHNYTPHLRRYEDDKVLLVGQPGVIQDMPTNPWINLGLFIATLVSVTFMGALYECGCLPTTPTEWFGGIPMLLTLMSILLAHEFGHYFAAKYYKLSVTLPYFIPFPLPPLGTMGAFIQLRSPFKTKRELFDIGVAGPLAGLVFAIPLVIYGVSSSPVNEITRSPGAGLEGNSVAYLAAKYFVHGELLPSFDRYSDLGFWQEFGLLLFGIIPQGGGTDIMMTSVALAAWAGFLVTAINLLPIGQLDGGHVAYCLLGDKARWLGIALIGVITVAAIAITPNWILMALLLFLLIGPDHPPPLNELAPLGTGRTLLAYTMIVIFLLLFTPVPFQILG